MPDVLTRRSDTRRARAAVATKPASVVASAEIIVPSRLTVIQRYPWQQELWNFYREENGAFKYAMNWHTQTMSRVRLIAALQRTNGEPPEPVTDGPASEALRAFYGGPAGQSQYMAAMDLQLQVPGEGFVVGRDTDQGYDWCVHSSAEIDVVTGRSSTGRGTVDLWRVQVDENKWEVLPEGSYVFRQWINDPEKQWRPDSPARGALPILRLISMLERRIMSQASSRMAMNGFLKYADEITFPVNPQFKDAPDPFMAELLDIAQRVMDNPGSALAAMPLPIKLPAEHFDKFEHVEFSNPYDEKVMEILNGLYDKLSVAMNMPKEVITGMGDTSHWNAWSLDEQGIETHIKPGAESICQGLTKAYLKPWLTAAGAPLTTSDGEYVIWYTTEELDVPPDMSSAADGALDRLMIKPESYLRYKGMDKADAPNATELRQLILLQAVRQDPSLVADVIKILTGSTVEITQPAPPATPTPGQPPAEQPEPNGPPPNPGTPVEPQSPPPPPPSQ